MIRTKFIQKAATILFVVGAFISMASASWATSYYVSTSGSDTNTGTSTTAPVQTIQRALNLVHAGDTVNIMAGTYNASLKLVTSGTSSAPITVQNYNGGTVIVNSGTSRAVYLGSANGAINYYTISGLTLNSTIQGSYSGGNSGWHWSIDLSSGSWWGYGAPADNASPNAGNNGFVIKNCNITGGIGIMGNHCTVTGCNINGNNQLDDGIFDVTIVSHHNSFTHNTIYNMTNRAYHGMSNVSYDDVSYNTCYNCGTGGNGGTIDFDGEWLPLTYCSANYNVIYNCMTSGASGIQFENGFYATVIGNTIYNCDSGIIMINYAANGENGGTAWQEYRNTPTHALIMNNVVSGNAKVGIALIQSPGNNIYNNTIMTKGSSQGAIGCFNAGYSDYTSYGNNIQNNIITGDSHGIVVQAGNNGSGNNISNNVFYGNGSNGSTGTNAITGNPNLVNTSSTPPNLKISTASSALHAGLSIAAVTTDILGNPRPVGSAYDIGAYQLLSATKLPSPPANLKVQ